LHPGTVAKGERMKKEKIDPSLQEQIENEGEDESDDE
jgi:hypothetical protein